MKVRLKTGIGCRESQPKVFMVGTYTVEVDGKLFKGLEAHELNTSEALDVRL